MEICIFNIFFFSSFLRGISVSAYFSNARRMFGSLPLFSAYSDQDCQKWSKQPQSWYDYKAGTTGKPE
jgi:hypothetical protein